MNLLEIFESVFSRNGIITAFLFVGCMVWISYFLSEKLTKGRLHGSAVAIMLGLILAYWGGTITGGDKGLADITFLSGVGILGGADICIVP